MAKLHSDNARRTIAWVAFFTAILYWRSWRDIVPQTVVGVVTSLNWSEVVHDPKFSAILKHDTGNRSLPTHTSDQLGTADLHRPKLLANQRLLTGILPVSSASLGNLEQMLEPLLDPSAAALRDIVLLLPSRLRSRASKLLLRVLTRHEGRDHPEISLRTWDAIADGSLTSPSMLRFLDPGISSWALIMDYGALEELDQDTRRRLLGEVVDWRLPYGPKGTPKNSSDFSTQWFHTSQLQPTLASQLYPPFVLPLDLLSSKVLPHTWRDFSQQVALCNSWNISGLLVGKQILPATRTDELTTPVTTNLAQTPTPPPIDIENNQLRFDIILSDRKEVQDLSPLLCGLLSRGNTVRILVVDTTLNFSFSPMERTTHLITGIPGCELQFFTVSQYMRRKQLFNAVGGGYHQGSHVIITLKSHSFADFLIERFWFNGNVLVEIPRDDLPFCDWMASLSLQEWQHWDTPRVEISVITRDRPESFSRLLRSLSRSKFYGDAIDLRINIEQDCDFQTLDIAKNYSWPHGSVFLHHRVVHAGLLTAIVESWYPRNNDTYGLLLEDDVEVSPLFYAWVKMSILKYRYGSGTIRPSRLFGISLYQQKNVELRPEGRIPFNARELFVDEGLPFPSTPYLSQVPCSWGAVYFPEHWTEFHNYLLSRFSESWLSMEELIVVPHGIRSNHWLRSWKKYFIELAFLKGYVMLYPNYEGYLSLSTNHLEYGAHVKTRTKEKRQLFDQPLFPLPGRVGIDRDAGMPGETGLLRLPGKSLPRYRDLPVLNLTAGLTREEDLARIGEERLAQLPGSTFERRIQPQKQK